MEGDRIKVLSTLMFREEYLDKLQAVSPRLFVEQRSSWDPTDMVPYLKDVEVLYTFGLPPDLLESAPKLRWVQLHSAGVNHILDHPIMASDIPITTTSGIHAVTIAEYVFASILAFTRRVPRMVYWQGQGRWPEDKDRWPLFVPDELWGKTIGIVGYGSIGRQIARLAKAFGMRIVAAKKEASDRLDRGYRLEGVGDPEGKLPDRIYPPERLRPMLAECDFVVVCVPVTRATAKLIGEPELKAMKPTAYLVNVARGEVVDEQGLITALQEGWIAGAGLDVFDQEPLPPNSPLYNLDNVILSPHVSGFTPYYDERASDLFAENLRRYLAGEELLNLVSKERGY
ncbi:MAG: D-2-hydroxyacid dehydrogenase [Anaerolineae bacterium]